MTVVVTMHVRDIRKAKRLTIMELSSLSGVSKSHISEIETGKQVPTISILCQLAEAMDVESEELYTYIRVK